MDTKRIEEFVKNNKVELYRTIPEGWVVLQGAMTAPIGALWIFNGKSRFTHEYKNALCLDASYFLHKIKEELKALEEEEEEGNRLDALWENDAENKEIEKQWDASYKKEWELRKELSSTLAFFLDISENTAFTMLKDKRDSIKSLLKEVQKW